MGFGIGAGVGVGVGVGVVLRDEVGFAPGAVLGVFSAIHLQLLLAVNLVVLIMVLHFILVALSFISFDMFNLAVFCLHLLLRQLFTSSRSVSAHFRKSFLHGRQISLDVSGRETSNEVLIFFK